jgi:hypothetical protein
MPHHRARFTARGRYVVVRRVIEDGQSFAQAAAPRRFSPGLSRPLAQPKPVVVDIKGKTTSFR